MPSRKERLNQAIDLYDKSVIEPTIHDLKINFYIQIIYLVLMFVFGIVANVNPTAATVIGAIGIGGVGVTANFDKIQTATNQFLTDKRKLETAIAGLRTRLTLCDDSDDKCLDDVDAPC